MGKRQEANTPDTEELSVEEKRLLKLLELQSRVLADAELSSGNGLFAPAKRTRTATPVKPTRGDEALAAFMRNPGLATMPRRAEQPTKPNPTKPRASKR